MRRQEIYEEFQGNTACQAYFFEPTRDEDYATYYTSMYLLQDATESLIFHRLSGFAPNPLQAYLEFWGVMQAAIIQQDSISELFSLIVGQPLEAKALTNWMQLRDLRNVCAGHPARRDRSKGMPRTRSFMGRAFGDYSSLKYERWELGQGTSYPVIRLGLLFDDYAAEAEAQLGEVLRSMQTRWSA